MLGVGVGGGGLLVYAVGALLGTANTQAALT
jgi:hypothetical protein